MNRSLLDTNVVSALRSPHRHSSMFQAWVASVDLTDHWLSVLTLMEIEAGVLKLWGRDPQQALSLKGWLARTRIDYAKRTFVFDAGSAEAAAPLWTGRSRGLVDTLLAGTALAHRCVFVTRNAADFDDIPGLTVVNPWDETSWGK